MIPPTTTTAIQEAAARFDRELRDSPEWRDWVENRAHKFAMGYR